MRHRTRVVALLRAGIDIDGFDISADMLHYCQRKTAQEGLHTNLYNQQMHAFELPRKYKTIYICGSFGLAGSREKDLETLRHCYSHLEDGGERAYEIYRELGYDVVQVPRLSIDKRAEFIYNKIQSL